MMNKRENSHLTASHHMHAELNEALQATPIQLGEGAVGQAAAMRAPVQIADALIDPEILYLNGCGRIFSSGRWLSDRCWRFRMLRERQIIGGLVVLTHGSWETFHTRGS